MNEELQSTNEELQSSKEELQSINEELETVNTEMSHKVEQLDRAHSDLQNLFSSTQIATIFLDTRLRIVRFTPSATEMFRLLDGDIGRPIGDMKQRFVHASLDGKWGRCCGRWCPGSGRSGWRKGTACSSCGFFRTARWTM
jgi:two-component system CheB/CheR fusion protein